MSPNDQSGGGFAKEIDLRVTLPLGAKGADAAIDISLMPRSRVRPSASLLDGVYLHQFMPEQLSGPPGLVGKPMMATEGYEGETVWYDPIGQSPFAAILGCIDSRVPPELVLDQRIGDVFCARVAGKPAS